MEIKSAEFWKSGVRRRDYPTDAIPQIAFAGRSNVGKSSLINALVRRKNLARSSKTPGRTQMVNFFRINQNTCFVDLPGYGYARAPEAEQRRWRPMIEAYLEDNPRLRGVVVLLDCRHEPTALDLQLLDYLASRRIPFVPVATKIDKLSRSQRAERLRALRRTLAERTTGTAGANGAQTAQNAPQEAAAGQDESTDDLRRLQQEVVPFSALKREGREELLKAIAKLLEGEEDRLTDR